MRADVVIPIAVVIVIAVTFVALGGYLVREAIAYVVGRLRNNTVSGVRGGRSASSLRVTGVVPPHQGDEPADGGHFASLSTADGPDAGTPAGWYQDPTPPGIQRFWDGSAWSSHRMTSEGVPIEEPELDDQPEPIWATFVLLLLGGAGIWFAQTYKPTFANQLGLNNNTFVLKPETYHIILFGSAGLAALAVFHLLTVLMNR
jgi:hypothetical protein